MDEDIATDVTENIADIINTAIELVTAYGLSVIGAIAILIIGVMAAGWAERATSKALTKAKKIDDILRGFFASSARYAVMAFTVIAVLNQFGVETTSFIAVLGAAGLAIGLALQGTLSNVAAGVMLLIFRPFKVGDFIECGSVTGVIDRVTLFITEMHSGDNIQIIVPNAQLWNTSIRNYSHHATRRIDLTIGIGYDADINKAMDLFRGTLESDDRVNKEPEPLIAVTQLGASSVDILVRFWCASGDYWGLTFDMNKALKEACDGAGISIPYPHRTVEVIQKA